MKNVFCPALGVPAVKDEFNKLKETVGETAAYRIWDLFKGNIPETFYNSANIMFQKQSNITQINNNYVVSERTIRDLAARMANRIGLEIRYESDLTKDYKGKLANGVATINLAHATLDTPIHEILGHPIIRAIKGNILSEADWANTLISGQLPFEENQDISSEAYKKYVEWKKNSNKLYQNLLKELEYGRGKEVLDRIKRDYTNKANVFIQHENNVGLGDLYSVYSNGRIVGEYFTEEEAKEVKLQEENKLKYTLEEQQEEAIVELLGLYTADRLDKVKDGKLISLLKRLLKEMKQFVRSLLTQKEVEISTLPDNMTLGDIADLLAYSNSKLILPGYEVVYTTPDNQKFKTYSEASKHIGDLAASTEDVNLSNIKLNYELSEQENKTVEHLKYKKKELEDYFNSEKYKQDKAEELDELKAQLASIESKPLIFSTQEPNLTRVLARTYGFEDYDYVRVESSYSRKSIAGNEPLWQQHFGKEFEGYYIHGYNTTAGKPKTKVLKITKEEAEEIWKKDPYKHLIEDQIKIDRLKEKIKSVSSNLRIKSEINNITNQIDYITSQSNSTRGFIEINKEFEQSKEIIEEWKKINNIKYNPEEVYSRGQRFYHSLGAYTTLELDLLLQNILQHIQDTEKAGGSYDVSAFTDFEDINNPISNIGKEKLGSKARIVIYPNSEDILWAANSDVNSGSLWDANEKITSQNKILKKELAGVSYSKYPSLEDINAVQPNLASIIDNIHWSHNELGITLRGNNWRLELEEDSYTNDSTKMIPVKVKELVKKVNSILDQKYGKLVKPEIHTTNRKNIKFKVNAFDPGSGEPYVIGSYNTEEEARQEAKKHFKDIKNPEKYYNIEKVIQQQGIQPTQTNETLKESIGSIKNKVTKGQQFDPSDLDDIREDFKDGKITQEQYDILTGQLNKKEYTEQALINTKIAKLKEVAKKYPRSLISSEVRPISNMYPEYISEDNELLFQKVSSNTPPLTNEWDDVANKESELNEHVQKIQSTVRAIVTAPGYIKESAEKHLPKELFKIDRATQFIGTGKGNDSTTQRMENAYNTVSAANTGRYTDKDLIFVAANGNRKDRVVPVVEGVLQDVYTNIDVAILAKASFILDTKEHLGKNNFNIGEIAIAKYLASKGYKRDDATGIWSPSETSAISKKVLNKTKKIPVSELAKSNINFGFYDVDPNVATSEEARKQREVQQKIFQDMLPDDYTEAVKLHEFMVMPSMSIIEKERFASNLAYTVSEVLDALSKTGQPNRRNRDFDNLVKAHNISEEDKNKLIAIHGKENARHLVMEQFGVEKVLAIVKASLLQRTSPEQSSRGMLSAAERNRFNSLIKLILNDSENNYFINMINMANGQIKRLEGFIMDTKLMKPITQEVTPATAIPADTPIEVEVDESSEATMEENWMLTYLRRSFIGNLSQSIKTRFARIVKRDPVTGGLVYNEFGGIEYYRDADIYNHIMDIIFTQSTASKQVAALEALSDTYPWIPDVLAVLKNDPEFNTKFFMNFRKDKINYYKVYKEAKKKQITYSGKIVNHDSIVDKFKEDIISRAKSGGLKLYKPLQNVNQLDKRVGVKIDLEEWDRLNTLASTLLERGNVLTSSTSFDSPNAYKTFILGTDTELGITNAIFELLHGLGITGITQSVLEQTLFYKIDFYSKTSIDRNKTPYMRLLKDIKDVLRIIKVDGLNPKEGTLSNKEGDKSIIAYKEVFRNFEKFIEQPVEKVIHSNGNNYYTYASPNFINRLVNKLSTLSNAEVVKYIEDTFFDTTIHGRFADQEAFGHVFSSWLLELYNDAKKNINSNVPVAALERGKFVFNTFLANDKKEFSELLPHELVETALYAFRNSATSYDKSKGQYMLPVLADKGVNGFITWRKDTGPQFEKNISHKLFSVFMQEVDRIATLQTRHLERNKNGLVPLANYDIESSNDQFTFKKGDRFLFLPGFQKYFQELYNKDYNNEITALFRVLFDPDVDLEVRMQTLVAPTPIALIEKEINSMLTAEFQLWETGLITTGDFETIKKSILPKEATNEQFSKALREFFFNNYYAQTQIMQLTVGDIAFYKNVDDIQKRLAQLRAPGSAYDIEAINIYDAASNGKAKFTEDGIQRSIVINDFFKNSKHLDTINKVYDKQLAKQIAILKYNYRELPEDTVETKKQKQNLIKKVTQKLELEYRDKKNQFTVNNLNTSDGQSAIGIGYFRKTEGTLGRWNLDKEALYQYIKEVLNMSDISLRNKHLKSLSWDQFQIFLETRKPFSYGLVKTPALDGSTSINNREMTIVRGVQTKNAEMILLDMFALLKSGDEFNIEIAKLLMDTNLDIVHTASTIKTGVQGILDVKDFASTKDFISTVKQILSSPQSLVYKQHVLELPMEDVVLQVETPSKFEQKEQPIGTQQSKIVFEGLTTADTVVFNGMEVNARTLERFYEAVMAAKVNKSYEELLTKKLGITPEIRRLLESSREEFLLSQDKDVIAQRLTINSKLSKLLLSQMVDSSRFSFDLIMAASLSPSGEFIIPLNDELQFDRIQQVLNSLIKEYITKQSTAGAQLIQVTDGLRNGEVTTDESLNIVWNYDIHGEPVSIDHFEAELPAYQKAFYENFIDENGYLHPEWMPEELRFAIAYRIPTEGLCSMIPIKIIRFSNKLNGGMIKLPAEITAITGADFDIDKLFIMFPTIVQNYSYKKELFSTKDLLTTKYKTTTYYDVLRNSINHHGFNWNDFTDIRQLYGFLYKNRRDEDLRIARGIFNRYLLQTDKANKYYTRPIVEIEDANELEEYALDPTASKSLENFSHAMLNNTLLDINLAVMQNAHNLFTSINPSGFPNITRISNIISILKTQPDISTRRTVYNSLQQLDNDAIKNRKKTVTDEPNYFSFGTQVAIHKRNFVGQSLIGITANGNSSHAILQHYDIKLKPTHKSMNVLETPLNYLTLNGVSLASLMKYDAEMGEMYLPFSSVYDHTGAIRISNKIRELLAAAVDSAKLPIFDDANIDKVTVNLVETIIRLGLDEDSAILLINQPIVIQFLKYLLNTTGATSTHIADFLEVMEIAPGFSETSFNSELLNEDLASYVGENFYALKSNPQQLSDQIQAFKFLIPIIYLSEDLRMLNTIAKQDAQAAAPGPTIADTLAKQSLIKFFNTKVRRGDSYFHETTSELLNEESPLRSAMLAAYYNKSKQASNYIFGIVNPMYLYEFQNIIENLQRTANAPLKQKTIKALQNDFALFKLFWFDPTNRDNDELDQHDETLEAAYKRVIRGHKGATRYYTLEFPKKIAASLLAMQNSKEYEHNIFVQNLKLAPVHKNSEMLVLVLDSLGMDAETKRQLGTGWADLILGTNYDFNTGYTAKEVGLELIVYSLYRNGFKFGNRSFLYALSPEIKARLPKYLTYLRESSTVKLGEYQEQQFLNLFKRHHSDFKEIVPDIFVQDLSNYMIDHVKNEKQDTIVEFTASSDLGSIIKVSKNKYDFELYERISTNFSQHKATSYRIVTPLGVKGIGMEYTPDMLTRYGHTKKSIYLQNDYDKDLFDKEQLISSNTPVNSEEDVVGETFTDEAEGTNVFNMGINPYTDFINDYKNKKFTEESVIKKIALELLSSEAKTQYQPTETAIKQVQDILDSIC